MTAKNTKYTIPLLVLAVLIPLGFINAQTTPGDEGPVSEPAYTENPTLSEKELDAKFDDIMFSIIELQVQNDELAMHSVDEAIQDEIDNNNEVIEGLFAELDELIPPIQVVEISPEDRQRMNKVMDMLSTSGIPLIGLGIDPSTGHINVEIDANKAELGVEDEIMEITGDIPITIIYSYDYPVFQSSCNKATSYCNPIHSEP